MSIRKSKSRKAAVAKADKYFSLLVRLEAADKNGYCKCVSCGKRLPLKEIQCGHYHLRKNYSTRWDFRNAHPQCPECNGHDELYEYSKYMFEHYTVKELDKLNRLAHTIVIFHTNDLDAMSQQFLDEIKKLQKEKRIYVL